LIVVSGLISYFVCAMTACIVWCLG